MLHTRLYLLCQLKTLHLNTSLVMDPIVVSNPIDGSAHLLFICRDLRVSILSVEFECNAFVLGFTGLWVDSRPGLVIQ